MTHPVKGIDHVFLLVADLDASAAAYRRLGFTLSPRGTHSPEMGSANYTMIFGRDYVELLGMIADTPRNLRHRERIARDGEGLRAIACRIDDANAARSALAAIGIEAGPVGEFSRPLPLPDGSAGVAAFATTEFAPDEIPTGSVFMCQHKTRDMVWRPELQVHPNGATGIAGVVAAADDPERMAAGFARLFAAGEVSAVEGGFSVATGPASAAILCLSRTAAAARYDGAAVGATPATGFAALQIAVADPDRARAALAAGVTVHDGAGSFWVAPGDASGTIVEFVRA
ncbi:catechol 2,3-dioxygenase-like lactoylglutathione lyase family enzyme [Amaricoccus macauensis]|uniref:Catechol 2,3-dioxygenase-like lactoylglutathione lyase family enzyme n=1 Tax=Amaricoccus macauensis TaxID=57001 RepID=A0A840SQZ2_9RHOB|nr:VOC family protein [Amaricoccus macauensis]MBB5222908.1 catechol 2,3-dioxygenase-like lactoylglutathione lyase family enzyme [Amaricoccus macauensis]